MANVFIFIFDVVKDSFMISFPTPMVKKFQLHNSINRCLWEECKHPQIISYIPLFFVLRNMAYINAAFRSSKDHEVYFFMKNKYVRVHYTPGKSDDTILTNLSLISSGFPVFKGTLFAEPGIDCSFNTEGSEAYVFSTNQSANLEYTPDAPNDRILSGPATIAEIFPVLKNTVFEDGIDSAFRSTIGKEVYIFKYNQYTCIDYDSKQLVANIRKIVDGFPVLRGTIFENGIDASFASHEEAEAYLFKEDKYVRIKFTPHTTNTVLLSDIKPIIDGWPCLKDILPVT